jgi:hypothetical protein
MPELLTRLTPTSREVARAIRAAHRDLKVCATWSFTGDMMTEWALPGAEAPILRQRTTYTEELNANGVPVRADEQHEQWLIAVVGVEGEDE